MNASDLIETTKKLKSELASLRFGDPVSHVYNPLDYAWAPHRMYLERYGAGPKEIVLVGMNPGPWGMVQTGVPFGEIDLVRDWMGIQGRVEKPEHLHPKRPVQGFDCKRHEVSGRRLWGWAKERYSSPERFFARFFVLNYCPLAFFDRDGGNRTPDKLPAGEREPLFAICDAALADMAAFLQPRYVLGIGRFAAERAASALQHRGIEIGMAPHPSPANPKANQGWGRLMDEALEKLGIEAAPD